MHRFFAPALDPGDEIVDLPRGEAEHLLRVLRLGEGDRVAIFDGRGREYLARVTSAPPRTARVQILSRLDPAPEPAVRLTLAAAVLKADRLDDVVRDAVMLGAAAVQPVVSRRTELTVASLVRGARVDRWKRIALASVKQSGRAVLPEIRGPLAIESLLAGPAPALGLMLLEPRAGAPVEPIGALRSQPAPPDATILVGPEGGWCEAEWTAARDRGFRLLTLGSRTLRADAAPVAAISVLQFLWNDL
ncbi:MAG: 16S rRNA (uracil(1498)-N(3))-methyltransferase [Acidobacteria bacterium]|nr:16S rRNA (uracil(1498)-N(3))-methyltransferase [Acidobacteriota bacterium]